MGERHFYTKLLRSCAHCGSFWGQTDVLCARCWEQLGKTALKGRNQNLETHDWKVQALFLWNQKDKELIKSIIYAIKSGWSEEPFFRLANFLELNMPAEAVLVPAPPRELYQIDHASVWARALGIMTGLTVATPLKRTDLSRQKEKSKSQREELEILKIDKIRYQRCPVVFLDDVITTGATARAAYIALGRPRDFRVCCIVCNPRTDNLARNLSFVL